MSRAISNKIHGIEKKLFLILAVSFFFSLGLYGYFVGKSIINIVVREEIEFQIAEVNSTLSGVELEYLSQKDTINLLFAKEQGFKSVSKKSFVNRSILVGRSLSQNNEI